MNETIFLQIKNWMYRNARPLDLARWQYHFESERKENVLLFLAAYQNEDGGFSKALEADAWNPSSSPIQTWVATEILYEINFEDKNHALIQSILKYLDSEKDFINHRWLNTIESNNEYPHAPWWTYKDETSAGQGFNPSISLAGFVMKFGDEKSKLFKKSKLIVDEGIEDFLNVQEVDRHVLKNYVRFMNYVEAGDVEIKHFNKFKVKLIKQVNAVIESDTSKWATEYVCKPSELIDSKDSLFYPYNSEVVAYELDFLLNNRNDEGVWDIAWSWGQYDKEFAVSQRWWQGDLVIKYGLYLRNFNKL